MPIRLNWNKGKFRGIALFYLGIMGLCQSLIIVPLAQYILNVGSLFVLVLLPIGVTVVMMYSAQVLYEAYAQARSSRSRRYRGIREKTVAGFERGVFRPLIIIIISFIVVFFTVYTISNTNLSAMGSFVLAENISAIISLVIGTVMESQMSSKM